MKIKDKKQCLCTWIFGSILFLLPFLHVNTGIEIADVGYNLANYEYMSEMNPMWRIATLLANLVGTAFTYLPFGHTMVGMNFYCMALLGGFALFSFMVLKKVFPAWSVFVGELIAIGFCWSPKVVLYHYLSYYLFGIAAILLVSGLKNEKKSRLLMAGVVLGLNVFVRFPNIVECALIVVVVYDAVLNHRRMRQFFANVGWCVLGFVGMFLVGFGMIELIFGGGSYVGMIRDLFGMTEEATGYTPMAMVETIFRDYLQYIQYFLWFVLLTGIGYVCWGFLKKKWAKILYVCLYGVGFLVILRVYYYYGVLNLHYNEYVSMYVWGVCILLLAIVIAIITIVKKGVDKTQKLLALSVLTIIFITPIGSNNGLYTAMNNLFLVAPFVIGSLRLDWTDIMHRFQTRSGKLWVHERLPLQVGCVLLCGVVLLQSSLFGLVFTFRDTGFFSNMTTVEGNAVLRGMRTNPENARQLSELAAYINDNGLKGRETVFFGHLAMVSYAMELPCAITHTWPSIDSYPTEEFVSELYRLDGTQIVVYEANYYGDLLTKDTNLIENQKELAIAFFLQGHGYREMFRNDKYVVCMCEAESILAGR